MTVNVAAGQHRGTGSGIVIKSDGYILTNNHVVTLEVAVTLTSNGKTKTVQVTLGSSSAPWPTSRSGGLNDGAANYLSGVLPHRSASPTRSGSPSPSRDR